MDVFNLAFWQSFLPFLRLTWWQHYFLIIGIWSTAGGLLRLVLFLRAPHLPKMPLAFLDKYILFILRRVVLKAKNPQAIIICCAAYGMIDLFGTTRAAKMLWNWNYRKKGKR